MTDVRVVAIDDEPLALQRLDWCLRNIPNVVLAGKTRDARKGLDLVRTLAADVVLLDIQMPGMNGFEFIDALGEIDVPEVIFVTAFDNFAVRAFAARAVDYLLKPVEQARLLEALERARGRLESRSAQARIAELKDVVDSLRVSAQHDQVRYERELWIREGDARVRVPVGVVERFEADGDYVRLHVGSRVRLLRARLSELAKQLDPACFVRIHRSEIVRRDLVAGVRKTRSGRSVAVLHDGCEIPISRRYLATIVRALRGGRLQD